MTLLEQLQDPNEVKRWFDQIGFQAAQEIESLRQQLAQVTQERDEAEGRNEHYRMKLNERDQQLAQRDRLWGNELVTVFPSLQFMSFAGPEATATWIGQQLAQVTKRYEDQCAGTQSRLETIQSLKQQLAQVTQERNLFEARTGDERAICARLPLSR